MADTKKYGLIIKKRTTENPLKKSTVFGNESSDEEDAPISNINVSLMREAQKKKQMKQTQLEIEKALKEDPSVYEYDNIYDEMAEKKKTAIPKLAEKDRKPKYIKGLLESAKSRKMEEERRMERKIQKEREQEGGEFLEKEEFVTSAYRKRMLELQEEEELLKKQEALDAANDVTKKSDLTMFYSNLLKHNVSMGGSFSVDNTIDSTDNDRKDNLKEDKPSISKKTKDFRKDFLKDSQPSRTDRESHHSSSSKHRDSDVHHREHGRRRRRSFSEERSYRGDRSDEPDRTSRKDSEDSARRHSESRRDPDILEKSSRDEPGRQHKSKKESSREETKMSSKNDMKTAKSDNKGEEVAIPSKFVKRSDKETISSARERFLERKRAREMQRKQNDSDED